MIPQIQKTIWTLNLFTVLHLIMIPALLIYAAITPDVSGVLVASAVWSMFMVAFLRVVKVKLREQRTWAWIAALIFCSIVVCSILMPFAIYGLIGLLSVESRNTYLAT